MPKPPTSFLIALLASGCTFTLSTLSLAFMPAEENSEGLSDIAVVTLAAGAVASLMVGGATFAYAESRRIQQQDQLLNQQLEKLESTLEEKNEKLVALALQTLAGSPSPTTPTQVTPTPSDPVQPLQTLLAWTSASPPPAVATTPPPDMTSPPRTTPTQPTQPKELPEDTLPVLPEEISVDVPEDILGPAVPFPFTDIVKGAEETEIRLEHPEVPADNWSTSAQSSDHRPWQVQLMLQQAKIEALETQLQEQTQARRTLEERLGNSLAREQSLRSQLEAQSERLMTLEAFQTQVKQQQQQIRQLHAALHKMKQQIDEKNKIVSRFEELQQELNNAKAALKGYHAVVKQNQELQASLQALKAKLPSPEEMNIIYDLVQRQRQRIQHLEAILQGTQQPRRQPPPTPPTELPSPDSEDYPPKWRDLIRESELYRF